MLNLIIVVMAIVGMTYGLKESLLLSRARNWLMMRYGFFAKLFFCWWCVSFWSGLFVYMLSQPFPWAWTTALLWGLAGSAIGGLFDAIYSRLTYLKTN